MNNADDTAALRTKNDLLEQLQEMLLYMITHELRTPVMTIMGFSDLLLNDWQHSDGQRGIDVPQSRQHIERIRAAAQRQNSIVQGLQQIAYLQRQPLQRSVIDVGDLVRAQLAELLPAQHNFINHVNNVASIHADATLMSTALHALLSILIMLAKASPQPAIEFGMNDRGYYLRADSHGFNLGAEPTLMLMIRHLQSGTDFAGAGINLLVATAIIYRHGGNLWVSTDDRVVTVCFALMS